MVRDFYDVVESIKEVAPAEFTKNLEDSARYWAPEIVWLKLSQFVNLNMEKNSKNPVSVKVYAILCNVSEEELKQRFEKDGY